MLEVKQRRRGGRLIWKIVGLIVSLGTVVGVAWWIYQANLTPLGQTAQQVSEPKLIPQPASIYSNILFMGNTFWGRYTNDWAMASPLKTAYPFSRLNEFHRDQYNAWITGLECPTKSEVTMTSAEMEVALQFNCSPEYLPEAAKWFTAFMLSNNHTDNHGIEGFEETKQLLDKNGIQYFGHYDPRVLEDVCEVISLPVTVTNDDESSVTGKLPVALCGYHGVFRIPAQGSIDVMKEYSQYMPVIAMTHMGAEYQASSDQLRTDFYRRLIDGGADMVLGDHPHWIQNTESYKGHLIVYSMGNFMFDQQGSTELTRSAAIKVVLKTNDSKALKEWLTIGDSCKTFHDTCLAEIKKQNLSKLDINFQFGVVGTNNADRLTRPATTDEQVSILQRLNWDVTLSQLQAPYSKL